MLRAENLVVEGKYLVRCSQKDLQIVFKDIKDKLRTYLIGSGYVPFGAENLFFSDFFSLSWILRLSDDNKKKIKLNPFKKELSHLDRLANIRMDMPYLIKIHLQFSQEGINIHVISKPAIFFQITQLNYQPHLDEFKYSSVVETNKEFIHEIMSAIHATEIEGPKPKSDIIKIHLRDKLDNFGFVELRNLLEKGSSKIQQGNTEDGLTDLRAALEKFLVKMVEKIDEKPESQDKVKNNLNILKDKGFIDEKMFHLILEILYKWLYTYLSEKPVHKREMLNLYDTNFLFTLFEDCMEYILYKVMYRV